MPPKKRKNSGGPPTMSKKKAKTASHTATNSINSNDPAILALTDKTRNRAARRPVVDTPRLSGNQSQAVNKADSQITRQIGNQSQPGVTNDVDTQITRQIVDNISSRLENIVERKISEL